MSKPTFEAWLKALNESNPAIKPSLGKEEHQKLLQSLYQGGISANEGHGFFMQMARLRVMSLAIIPAHLLAVFGLLEFIELENKMAVALITSAIIVFDVYAVMISKRIMKVKNKLGSAEKKG